MSPGKMPHTGKKESVVGRCCHGLLDYGLSFAFLNYRKKQAGEAALLYQSFIGDICFLHITCIIYIVLVPVCSSTADSQYYMYISLRSLHHVQCTEL